jgi:hypothetical protein
MDSPPVYDGKQLAHGRKKASALAGALSAKIAVYRTEANTAIL